MSYSNPTRPGLDSTPTAQYAYDKNGNLCFAATGATAVTCTSKTGTKLTYDSMNRMTAAGAFKYVYDPVGNLTKRTYPDGTAVSYTFDRDNRLCGIVFTSTPASSCTNGTVSFDYSQLTADPSKVTKNFPSGQTISTFDRAGRLTNLVNRSGAGLTVLSSFDPTLSPAGFPQSVAMTNNGLPSGLASETQTYTFDPTTARLNQVCYDSGGTPCGTGPGLTGVSYTYDGAGNIKTKATYGASPTSVTYGYDAANQLTTAGPATYTYTANGDRRTDGTTTLSYDLAHRLTKATAGSVTDAYTYDPLGNRATDAGATTTTYAWDPNAPVAQLATTKVGSASTEFFSGAGLTAMRSGTSTYYYDTDLTGSVANLVRSDGTTAYSTTYQPYGTFRTNRKNDSGAPENPMGFQSEYRDTSPTGFFNLRARMYDPATGSFLQPDPVTKFPSYSFAAGNPAMFADPSGMFPWKRFLFGLGIAAAVVGITACALATEGICAGFTVFGLGNTAVVAGGTAVACEEGGCNEAATAFEDLMAKVETLDVATGPNEAVFYSGSGNAAQAEEFALENGKTTLEMTPGGSWLASLNLYGAESPLSLSEADTVWARLSQRFAEAASGQVVGFVAGLDPSRTFAAIEYPALLANPNVTNVLTGGY